LVFYVWLLHINIDERYKNTPDLEKYKIVTHLPRNDAAGNINIFCRTKVLCFCDLIGYLSKENLKYPTDRYRMSQYQCLRKSPGGRKWVYSTEWESWLSLK
jgi:hypothetical protein